MNIELAPDVQLRMKHPVSGLNEIALAPSNKEKESPVATGSCVLPACALIWYNVPFADE